MLLQVELDQRIGSLSLGNRKKVGIIQALQHRPRLLILDEPTSGLDPLIQARFFEVLEEENRRGTTIFFSSHILSEVQRLCHRVGIIKEGRLIQVEEVEKLRSSHYRKVKVEFATPTQAVAFTFPGAQNLRIIDRTVEFLYQDQARSLLQALANLDILNLWIEEPSLEEVFLHYYEGKDGQ
ncbi:MAG: ABC transporter ATP-binding protein [Firmicutes bacterium]|nr:ABC transporter ATP-binding protein [Bacillota bacterium]MCL5039155.1 ABC transporter ATP-binding protein [Bacillota bacterium]